MVCVMFSVHSDKITHIPPIISLVYTVHSCAVLVHSHSSHQHKFQAQAADFSLKKNQMRTQSPLNTSVVCLHHCTAAAVKLAVVTQAVLLLCNRCSAVAASAVSLHRV